ncbi:hypothetical protein [Modestobacter sp. SYSU DS0290]
MTGTDDAELRRRFAEREQEVENYGKTWWTQQVEPQRSFFRTRPALRRDLLLAYANGTLGKITTYGLYREDTKWVPERSSLHGEVLDSLLGRVPPGAGTAGDAVYLTIGLPGSGKTSGLRPIALTHAGYSSALPVSDADEVRGSLPEYARGLGSGVVQGETEVLTYGSPGYPPAGGLQDQVCGRSGAVIVDVVGSDTYLPGVVRKLVDQGRTVYILMTECPVDVCVARAMKRAIQPEGRFVDPDLIRKKEGVPQAALTAALATGLVAGWGIVDTTQDPAQLVGGDGTFESAFAPDRVTRDSS